MTLSLDGVSKIYQTRDQAPVHAVRSLNLAVGRGDITALLGTSGSGKTATLRLIAGLDPLTDGCITLAGRRIEKLPPERRGVAMAFAEGALYAPMTVAQNIGLSLPRDSKQSKGRRSALVQAMADLLDIGPLLPHRPDALSSDQRQRVSLARALIRDAALYLLDEPMEDMDVPSRAVLRERVRALVKQRGLTVLLVTHDQTEAQAMADRIAVMEGGVLQQYGSVADLLDRPANLFVGGFFGEPPMNIIAAVVTPVGLRLEDGTPIKLPDTRLLPPGARVVVGVRPHLMVLGQQGLRLTVAANTWLGDQTHLVLEYRGRLLVAVVQQRVTAPVGTQVNVGFAPAAVHLFDAATGRALLHGGSKA